MGIPMMKGKIWGCWAGFAPFGYATWPVQQLQFIPSLRWIREEFNFVRSRKEYYAEH